MISNNRIKNTGSLPEAVKRGLKDTSQDVMAVAANTTLTVEDAGKTLFVSADAVITLPAASTATKGMEIRVVNVATSEAAEPILSPNAADGIYGTFTLAASVVEASGADTAQIKNTKASANKGDYVQIICDGTNGWFIIGSAGIWANV